MTLNKSITVRYRSNGHLRFDVPSRFLKGKNGLALRKGLERVQGVYRVNLDPRGKLSIRFFDDLCDVTTVAHALDKTLSEIERNPPSAQALSIADELHDSAWIQRLFGESKETLSAARIIFSRLLNRGENVSGESPKLVVDFFTDVLVLWLIKSHWHLIMDHWLKRPWTYRYQWSAAVYMIFLLVRSKKPKA
jgi:hypothetical protein